MFSGCFDISHNNGPVKWSLIPPQYALVFVKATQGTRFIDPNFDKNVEGAVDTGRLVVPYHFITGEAAALQAAHFIQSAKLHNGSQVMLDWESEDPKTLPAHTIVEDIISALRIVTNRAPVVYHGLYTLASARINACPWAVPKYGPKPNTALKWAFWQDTPAAKMPGVSTSVDHDWWIGTEQELRRWYTLGRLPANLLSAPPR